ncbi:hypothetical protein G7046_g9096 [Stylonectria norvegica]|nr:hypothetical protein G7046_g9096 [Stylonectria norvegica]
MASLTSRLLLIFSALCLLAAIVFKGVLPDDDPYRCRAVQDTGRWIDTPDANGDRLPFKKWQPDGCMFHKYSSEDIRQCMDGRNIVFAGDSTTRQVAYGLARPHEPLIDQAFLQLHRKEAIYDRAHIDFHSSFNLTYHGIQIQQHWNPYLDARGKPDEFGKHEAFVRQLDIIRNERENPPSMKDQQSPALMMIGVGAWFSGRKTMDSYSEALANVSDILGPWDAQAYIKSPMDSIDGVGNQVFFAPPGGPYYTGSDKGKIKNKPKSRMRVYAMQDWLRKTVADWSFGLVFGISELVAVQNKTFVDPTETGYHVIDSVAETKANILLNLRCNAKLDRVKGYPYNRTCCTDYGRKPFVQLMLVTLGLVYLVACVGSEIWDVVTRREKPRWPILSMETGALVMALLMCYFADRTHMFAKGDKVWSYADFAILCAPCIAILLVTIRKSRSKPGPTGVEADQPFLSRDQTDEWKGWMQFIILVYHWTAAAESKGIYVVRLAAVMLRLNILSVSLAYFMNTDYMFYYFSPLVSFWFMVVYTTMAVGHKRFNDDMQLVIAKILISAVLVATILLVTPLMRWTFTVLRVVFNIRWSLQEWEYRVTLDLFIVYIGMFAGVAYLQADYILRLGLRCTLAFVGLAVMGGYSYAVSTHLSSMDIYRIWHPYVSFAPILAFVALRNVSAPVRNYYSKGMAWLGRCSLETYTLQFHIFLAADTQGVLLIDLFKGDASLGDRWRSLIIIVPIFLWVSSQTAIATGKLANIILTPPAPPTHEAVPTEQSPEDPEKNHADDSAEDGDTESDSGEPLLYDPDSSLLGRSRDTVARHMKQMPSWRSLLASPQFRVILILLVMWLLNLLSTSYDAPIPDGYTPNRVKEGKTPAAPAAPGTTPA